MKNSNMMDDDSDQNLTDQNLVAVQPIAVTVGILQCPCCRQ
jgi:hypothetical protein